MDDEVQVPIGMNSKRRLEKCSESDRTSVS